MSVSTFYFLQKEREKRKEKREKKRKNANGRLAVLDLELEVKNGRIEHGYFEKACTSEVVIPYTSAHSRKMKMSIMVEEGVRRLRNAARGLDWERSRAVMETWSRKLRRSGYPATLRHEMIGASVRRYEKMCEEEDNGGLTHFLIFPH